MISASCAITGLGRTGSCRRLPCTPARSPGCPVGQVGQIDEVTAVNSAAAQVDNVGASPVIRTQQGRPMPMSLACLAAMAALFLLVG
jgi:hypothetical protein